MPSGQSSDAAATRSNLPVADTGFTRGPGGVEQQAFVQGLDIPRRWWELFHCDPLNSVVTRAIDRNPDLAAAQAALRIANANTQAARGGYYPQVGANIGTSSQKPNVAQTQPIGTGTSPYTIATGQLSVLVCPRCLRAQQAPRGVTCGTSRSATFRSRGSLSHLDVKARPGGDREASAEAVVGAWTGNRTSSVLRLPASRKR